jgi:hypothetical protein
LLAKIRGNRRVELRSCIRFEIVEQVMSGDFQKNQVQSVPTLPAEPPSSAKRPPDKKAGDTEGAEPGELLTGQTDPGLTLTGGGGHA